MFETAIAQLRFGASMALGVPFSTRSLDRIVSAMSDTKREFGTIGAGADRLISGGRSRSFRAPAVPRPSRARRMPSDLATPAAARLAIASVAPQHSRAGHVVGRTAG